MSRFRDRLPSGARTFTSCAEVQWCDVDLAGITYFAAYWRFAERAEMQLFEDLGFPYARAFDQFDIWIPRVRAEATYHAPSRMSDRLRLRTHVERVGGSSIAWRTAIFSERTSEALADLALTVACVDRASGKSCPIPPPMRAALVAVLAR